MFWFFFRGWGEIKTPPNVRPRGSNNNLKGIRALCSEIIAKRAADRRQTNADDLCWQFFLQVKLKCAFLCHWGQILLLLVDLLLPVGFAVPNLARGYLLSYRSPPPPTPTPHPHPTPSLPVSGSIFKQSLHWFWKRYSPWWLKCQMLMLRYTCILIKKTHSFDECICCKIHFKILFKVHVLESMLQTPATVPNIKCRHAVHTRYMFHQVVTVRMERRRELIE